MKAFRETVLAAVQAERDRGAITVRDALNIRIKLGLVSICGLLKENTELELALQSGNVSGLIDWENFDPEKFAALVKIIMEVIMMISSM